MCFENDPEPRLLRGAARDRLQARGAAAKNGTGRLFESGGRPEGRTTRTELHFKSITYVCEGSSIVHHHV